VPVILLTRVQSRVDEQPHQLTVTCRAVHTRLQFIQYVQLHPPSLVKYLVHSKDHTGFVEEILVLKQMGTKFSHVLAYFMS